MKPQRCTCKRRGCTGTRERWQLVCEECWAQVPAILRNSFSKARRLKLTRHAKRTGEHILKALGTRPAAEPNGPAARAARTYHRIAAQLGERVEMEIAE